MKPLSIAGLPPADVLIALYNNAKTSSQSLEASFSLIMGRNPGETEVAELETDLTLDRDTALSIIKDHARTHSMIEYIGSVPMYVSMLEEDTVGIDERYGEGCPKTADAIIEELYAAKPASEAKPARKLSRLLSNPSSGLASIRVVGKPRRESLFASILSIDDSQTPELTLAISQQLQTFLRIPNARIEKFPHKQPKIILSQSSAGADFGKAAVEALAAIDILTQINFRDSLVVFNRNELRLTVLKDKLENIHAKLTAALATQTAEPPAATLSA